jgi:tetratricopeptide (TPR) repeat protein
MVISSLEPVSIPQNFSAAPRVTVLSGNDVQDNNYLQGIEKGDDLFLAGDYDGAILAYDAVIARDPGIAVKDLWYNRGIAQNILGRYQEAVESFDHALVMSPDDPEVLAHKGAALISLGRYEDALFYTDRALAENSDTAWIWINRGIALAKLGQNKEARAAFDNAGVLEPADRELDLYKKVVGSSVYQGRF